MNNIIIDFSDNLVRTALVENGELVELFVDTENSVSIVGNIYSGIVKNILPSKFVFIDIGQEKKAFLSLEDSKEEELYEDGKLKIKVGSEILVQVIKDAYGTKGAGVTSQLSFSKDNIIIYKSNKKEIGISRKIEYIGERKRLKKIAEQVLPDGFSIILRTGSQGKKYEDILAEIQEMLCLSEKVFDKGRYIKAPAVVYKEADNLYKTLKILLKNNIDKVIINNWKKIEIVKDYVKRIKDLSESNLNEVVNYYDGEIPIFKEYFIETQIEKILYKKVWLKSGGFLIIEETEACVVIDVNTGKFLGNSNQQKTIIKTNFEAAVEIAKQIRLRNLSGMIIIDFIDMQKETDKLKLIDTMKKEVKRDSMSVNVLGMAYLGVMQITRKKTREPISSILLDTCTVCNGSGKIYTKLK